MKLAGYAVSLAVIVGCATGCGVTGSTTSASASPSADSRYAGLDGYQICLDDRGIAYRLDTTTLGTPDAPAVVLISPGDPTVASANTDCQAAAIAAQAANVDPNAAAESNAITQKIADCLEDRGYHVTTDDGGGLKYNDGASVLVYHVPDAERNSPQYPVDQQECGQEAGVG